MPDFHALIPSNAVAISGERLVTTSLMVAEVFGKRHDHVLRDIDQLDCSSEFRLLNFQESSRSVTVPRFGGRQERYFELTKNGFVFLVMGYTGAKAAQFKEAYIARFDAMEAKLHGASHQDADLVTIRRDDLWTLTSNLAALNVLLGSGMRSIESIERTTGEHWYGRPRPLATTPDPRPTALPDFTLIDPAQVAAFVTDKRQVTTAEICAGIGVDYSKSNQTLIGQVLKAQGWTKEKLRRIAGKPVRVYTR